MSLLIANQNFTAVVGGATVTVLRGDFYDSTTALAVQVAGSGLLSVLPDGITAHQIAGDWEG